MDPKDTPKAASVKKRAMLIGYTKPLKEKGFHFLTGNETNIRELTNAIGYRYVYDKRSDEYAHPAGIVIVSPEGKVSRYLFGIDYPPRDLRLALVEASNGRLGTITDRFLLFCYHYDPVGGKYGLQIMRSLRILGISTVLALLAFVFWMLRKERTHKKLPPAGGTI
jgi:protein SCO1/2